MAIKKKKGSYLGTEIDNKWWKRYREKGFFARGKGEFWMDADGIHFHRYLISTDTFIPWDEMTDFTLGSWHAGKWLMNVPVLKVHWTHDGKKLCSGFVPTRKREEAEQFVKDLRKKISKTQDSA